MIRHLLKPLWRRKGRNLLLSVEIGLAFALVFAIAAAGLRYWQIYAQPIGFEWRNVWTVQMLLPSENLGKATIDADTYARLRQALLALPEVEEVGFSAYSLFENSSWNTRYWRPQDKREFDVNVIEVSDEFVPAAGLKLVEGRGFSRADDGAGATPVLINRRFAEAAFPGRSAVGQLLSDMEPGNPNATPQRVVGVVEAFRHRGEYMAPVHFVIGRHQAGSRVDLRTIVLKLRPGTTRLFESELNRQLKLVRNDWSYRISPLADLRASMHTQATVPLMVLAVVAAFLLLMVAFGLFGVLWQNTTRRVPELGLRRATGATASDITRLIVFEQVLLCLLPIAAALLLLVQLPITGALGESLSWPLFGGAALVATAVMVLVSAGCAAYPAWRASRLSPTEALHYE